MNTSTPSPTGSQMMPAGVYEKFETYPAPIREKLELLRRLILEVAAEHKLDPVEETLKWGEPSYLVKKGSTIRIDWKPKSPSDYCIYFNCNTTLIATFKELYGGVFNFQGNRAMMFSQEDTLPLKPLRHCIALALRYHRIKHLPLLGA